MAVMISILSIMIGFSFIADRGDWTDAARHAGGVSIAIGPAQRASLVALPPIAGAPDSRRPLVVIDPGHGGGDPGATSPGGRREKDVTLALARAIRAELAASHRVRVALTRDGDRAISLPDRYEIARRLGADLFISVHADAAPHNNAARGATIYSLSEVASDREAALLATRENGASVVGGADFSRDAGVNRILIDLAQREAMSASADFARLLHREASPSFAFQPEYHRFASLIVLKAPDIPSILFESGYLTNQADEAFLQSPEGQRRIAQGMRKAIETHFARRALATAR
jgi:N-acetylmuramoyl-L-alanine amidase